MFENSKLFYTAQTTEQQKEYYRKMLQVVGSLSNLFSESDQPYLASRVTENLFCRCLNADNLSRVDITADAKKNNIGIGIKTWVNSNLQKIAEFNKQKESYAQLPDEEMIYRIADLRNDRIAFTLRSQGINEMVYHCTIREPRLIKIKECTLDFIDKNAIHGIERHRNSIVFADGINEYSFNTSKSTLYKRFNNMKTLDEIPVDIIQDPFTYLEKMILGKETDLRDIMREDQEQRLCAHSKYVAYLPLYSFTRDKGKFVPEKNNLNMRFAGGRLRDPYEVGIPIPAAFRKKHPSFFPGKNSPFNLYMPSGEVLSAKQCQQDGKALMSNPNKALGHWLIDNVLKIPADQPITYELLERYGIDAVRIEKRTTVSEDGKPEYNLNFAKCGSYEQFMHSISEEDEE